MARAPTRGFVARAPAPRARVAPTVSLVVAPKPSAFNTFKPGAATKASTSAPAMSFKPPFGPSALLPDEALIHPLATPAATPATTAPVPPPPASAGGGGGGAPASAPASYPPESSPTSEPMSGVPSSEPTSQPSSQQAPASTPAIAPMVAAPPAGALDRFRGLPRWQKIAILLAVLGIGYFAYTKFVRPKKSNPRRRRRAKKRSA